MSWFANAFTFLGNTGCQYLRIKTVLSVIFIIPVFCVILYFLVSTKTENEAYTVVGTVESVSFNAVKVSYIDPTSNILTTANVDTTNTNQTMIYTGAPLTVYVDKKNPSNVHAQQPFTKNVKLMILGIIFFVLGLLLFEIFASFFNNQICQVLGGAELVYDTFSTGDKNVIF